MQKLAALASGLVLVAATAGPALAQDNATVSAHITVDAPCLTVNTTTADFGHAPFSTGIAQTRTAIVNYSSCSSVTERVFAHATDAAQSDGPATWQLVSATAECQALGLNHYKVSLLQADNTAVGLQTTDTYVQDVPGNGSSDYPRVVLTMPCSGSDGAGVTMDFSITYTATF